MAHKYVYSGAGGSGTGADWTNAYTTLEAAVEAAGTAAGDNIWVAHDHNESAGASKLIVSKNTAAAPGTVICVNRAGTVPPVAADLRTTGIVTTTGNFLINFNGNFGTYIYGLIFNSGTGAVNANVTIGGVTYLHNCSLRKLGTTANSAAIAFSGVGAGITLDNTTVQFGNVADSITISTNGVRWKGTAPIMAGTPYPTTTLIRSTSNGIELICHGIDFSQLAAATPIYSFIAGAGDIVTLINCKLVASSVVCNTPVSDGAGTFTLLNCNSGAVNYRNEKVRYQGVQSVETTIVRTGGATDGTTPISWKFVTNANSEWLYPFDSLPLTIWNESTGSSKTLTVYGIWGGGAVPNNDDIWMEVAYLGSSATPIGSAVTSGKASYLATNAAYSSDSSTWGGSTTKFKMSVTFTPQMKGPLFVLIRVAKVSTTVYIDPEIEVT